MFQGNSKLKDRESNLNVITRRVTLLKQQYNSLNNLGKGLSCYSQDCKLQEPSKLTHVNVKAGHLYSLFCRMVHYFGFAYMVFSDPINTSNQLSAACATTCYSPICSQKTRLRRDLLALLRKANAVSSKVPKAEPVKEGIYPHFSLPLV